MANYRVIRTAKLTDRQVIDIFYAVKDDELEEPIHISLGPNLAINISSLNRDDEQVKMLDNARHAIEHAKLSVRSNISMEFYRGICEDVNQPNNKRQPSQYYDEIFFHLSDRAKRGESIKQIIECVDIIESILPTKSPPFSTEKTHDTIDVLQTEIASLSNMYQKMLSDLAEERVQFRKIFDEERSQFRKEVEEEIRATREKIKEEKADHRREMSSASYEFEKNNEKERESIDKLKKELDDRKQELDDRHHMHARRELRNQIATNFKERAGRPLISPRASLIRWFVFWLTLIAGAAIGYFGVEGFRESFETTAKGNSPQWLIVSLLVKSVLSLFLAVGFVAYAINWLRVVYLDDVRMERRYESNGDDIDRASFVIETLIEVGEKESVDVPDAWVEGVCRNLFADKGGGTGSKAPSDAVTMLLEAISGAKFGPDGTEFSLDRRGAKKLAKEAAKQ